MTLWHVWTCDDDGWRIVSHSPTTEHDAREAVAQMSATTTRLLGPGVEWLALPEGQTPSTRDDTDHSRVGIPSGDEGR